MAGVGACMSVGELAQHVEGGPLAGALAAAVTLLLLVLARSATMRLSERGPQRQWISQDLPGASGTSFWDLGHPADGGPPHLT